MPSKLSGGLIQVSFPYNVESLKLIKSIAGRLWDPANRIWTLPATAWHASEFERVCGKVIGVGEDVKILAKKLRTTYVEPSVTGNLDQEMFRVGSDIPFPYQVGAVEFGMDKRHRFINASEVGLGKTVEAIITARHYKDKKIVVVCPASITYKWQAALQHWYPELTNVRVIQTSKDELGPQVNIMSYNLMARRRDTFETSTNKPDLVIFDEAHRIRNWKTKQFAAAKVLVRGVPHIQALTGTPIINRPNELYNLLNILDPNAWTWVSYMDRYCGSRSDGYTETKNLPELEMRLKTIMLRQYKRQVMDQLPAITHTKVRVDIDKKDYMKIYVSDQAYMQKHFPSKPYFDNYLDWFQALRHHCEHAKIKAANEWISDFLETSSEKLVIYCGYKDSVEILRQAFYGYGVSVITGDVSQKERFNIIYNWQNTHKSRIMLITSAGGEGIDLFGIGNVKCSTLLFVGREWSPMTEDQIVGRIDRTGQTNPCQVVYLVANDTIDVDIDNLIEGKRAVIKQTVGIYSTDTSIVSGLRSLHPRTFNTQKDSL